MKVVKQWFGKAETVKGEYALGPVSWNHGGLRSREPGLTQGEDRESKAEKLATTAQKCTSVMRCQGDKGQ